MNNSPRMKLLTLCIGAALAQMAGLPALADTAVGVDTVNGNASNPGYLSGPKPMDNDLAVVKRSPSGQMYSIPAADKPEEANGQFKGSVDIGLTHQSDSKAYAKRTEYSDQRNGLYLNNFSLSQDSEGARYSNLNAGGVGRKDQFYDFTTGKYGSWKVKTFYNETMHIFTDSWKSFYNGEGTGNLSTGLAKPTMYVNPGAYTGGTIIALPNGATATYTGANTTGTTGCTALAPCWIYNGTVYGNAAALAAINGTTGTPNSVTGVIPTGILGTATGVGVNGASNTVQSNMAAAIAAKLVNTPYSELSLVRKKGGVRGDITLTDSVKVYASYSLEKRVGARPFAMNDNNISTEIAEPIDYKTHDFLAGMSFSDELTQANLRASASVFRNNISTMNVEYALLANAGPFGAIQHATFDLPPDNNAFNLKGEFARSLPDLWKGRFTAAASYGTNRQNDALLAPVSDAQSADLAAAGVTNYAGVNPGYASGSGLVSNWNTVNALSRQTANQRIDSKMIDLGLSLKPIDDLSVKGSFRFYDTANKGGYIAYNPLTGQFGRGPAGAQAVTTLETVVAPNGSGGCYAPPGFAPVAGCSTLAASGGTLVSGNNSPVFSEARSTRQYNYGIGADYDLTRTRSANLAVEREEFNRNFRERDKTWEDKIKLGYVDRALGDTTLRVSFENDAKRGSAYKYRTFEDLATGLPYLDVGSQVGLAGQTINGVTYPAFNAGIYTRYSTLFRKYDQADRNQKILNTRVNVMALEDLDVGVNLQVKKADYPDSFYGLKKDDQNSIGLDLNFQASVDRIVTAFYNYQQGKKSMSMNTGTALVGAACTAANASPVACADTSGGATGARPLSDMWNSYTTDRNDVLGLGWQEDLGFARLGIDYTYTHSSTHIAYDFGSTAFSNNATNNAAMAAVAGSALPDMTTVQHTFAMNLVRAIDKKTTIRATYRFDGFRVKDWHYDGVMKNVMAAYDAGTMLLDSGPMNYHVNTFGVFLNYKL